MVVDGVLEASISVRAERVEQDPVQRVLVVGVVVAAFGRVFTAWIALCPGEEEVVDRRADDVAALGAQDVGQFVGECGLAGGGRSVDGDSCRVGGGGGPDCLSQPAEQLVAGALIHIVSRLGLLLAEPVNGPRLMEKLQDAGGPGERKFTLETHVYS